MLVRALRFGYDKRVGVGKVSRWIGAAIGWIVGHIVWLAYLVVLSFAIGVQMIAVRIFKRLQREGPVDDGIISAELRRDIIHRDQLECPYGNRRISVSMVNIDHIRPWSRGGPTDEGNLQVTCGFHNRQKGDKTHDEYEAWRWDHRKHHEPCSQ